MGFAIDRFENIMGKEKMLVTSIFSFSHNVFKRFLLKGLINWRMCDTGLNLAFSDNNLNVTKEIDFDYHRVEYVAGGKRKWWLLSISLFPTFLLKVLYRIVV